MRTPPEFAAPTPEAIARVLELSERRLTKEEFDAYVNAPMSEAEAEGIRQLIVWFRRRYPSPAERLAYARRAYDRWTRELGRDIQGS